MGIEVRGRKAGNVEAESEGGSEVEWEGGREGSQRVRGASRRRGKEGESSISTREGVWLRRYR